MEVSNCVQGCGSGYLPFYVNYSDEWVFQQCKQLTEVSNCVQSCGSGLPFHVNYNDELVFQQCDGSKEASSFCYRKKS